MKNIFFVLLVGLMLSSCSSDNDSSNVNECDLIDCAPQQVFLAFFSSDTQENVFLEGTYSYDDVTVTNTENGESVPFTSTISQDFNEAFLLLPSFTQSMENLSYTIAIENEFSVNFNFSVVFSEGSCCFENDYINVSIENAAAVDNPNGDVYHIFL